ncbi:MAG: copper chaperone PCu(A)C [Lysobacter sp.]|nr:copper chaperone PCu(A)C [Lysobacter sp.]
MTTVYSNSARTALRARFGIAAVVAASLAISAAFSAATFAAGPKAKAKPTLAIENAWTRATPPKAPVAGGFLAVRNDDARADRLLSATSPDAERVEIHEMSMTDGVMRMRKLDDGLEIPAKTSTQLKPGGYHLMFIGPKHPFVRGETVTAMLRFERAGTREVKLEVREMGSR